MPDDDRSRWDRRYRDRATSARPPEPFLLDLDALLPRRGRALDVAGGDGRNAEWLARRGLAVTIADFSEVALGRARDRAGAEGLAIETLSIDLEAAPLPRGPWDLVVCVRFLHRPLFAQFARALGPGGLLVVVHPTRANLARHDRPGPRHLLDEGELPGLVPGLDVLHHDEGWRDDGRHDARLVARAPGGSVG